MSLSVLLAITTIVIAIFGYDYFKVIREVYKNQYLKVENTQLKKASTITSNKNELNNQRH